MRFFFLLCLFVSQGAFAKFSDVQDDLEIEVELSDLMNPEFVDAVEQQVVIPHYEQYAVDIVPFTGVPTQRVPKYDDRPCVWKRYRMSFHCCDSEYFRGRKGVRVKQECPIFCSDPQHGGIGPGQCGQCYQFQNVCVPE